MNCNSEDPHTSLEENISSMRWPTSRKPLMWSSIHQQLLDRRSVRSVCARDESEHDWHVEIQFLSFVCRRDWTHVRRRSAHEAVRAIACQRHRPQPPPLVRITFADAWNDWIASQNESKRKHPLRIHYFNANHKLKSVRNMSARNEVDDESSATHPASGAFENTEMCIWLSLADTHTHSHIRRLLPQVRF